MTTRLIRRYKGSRFNCTTAPYSVTRKLLLHWHSQGIQLKIVDHQTHKDVTKQVLAPKKSIKPAFKIVRVDTAAEKPIEIAPRANSRRCRKCENTIGNANHFFCKECFDYLNTTNLVYEAA